MTINEPFEIDTLMCHASLVLMGAPGSSPATEERPGWSLARPIRNSQYVASGMLSEHVAQVGRALRARRQG